MCDAELSNTSIWREERFVLLEADAHPVHSIMNWQRTTKQLRDTSDTR